MNDNILEDARSSPSSPLEMDGSLMLPTEDEMKIRLPTDCEQRRMELIRGRRRTPEGRSKITQVR